MATTPLRTICRWCEVKGVLTVLRDGDEPTSHGICATCRAIYFPKRAANGLRKGVA